MHKNNRKKYLYLFGFFLIIIILLRIFLEHELWRMVLMFLFPICLCFLLWAHKDYSVKKRIIIAISASFMSVIFWYGYSSVKLLAIIPFLSGLTALLISYYIDRRYGDEIK